MRKLSFGMFFFVILPLLAAVGLLVLDARRYWYLPFLAILFVVIVLGSVLRVKTSPSPEQQILRRQAKRAMVKKKLLLAIGEPDGPGNTLSSRQQELLRQYKELDEIDDQLLTEERKQLNQMLEEMRK